MSATARVWREEYRELRWLDRQTDRQTGPRVWEYEDIMWWCIVWAGAYTEHTRTGQHYLRIFPLYTGAHGRMSFH